jgi:DNA-binding winged helix-turn-helix (wHTH) protein
VSSPRLVQFGSFEVDLQTGELRKAGQKLKFSGQPFQVLVILLERPGEVVTREELQKRLWPDTFVDVDHNLNTAINKIREVLIKAASSPIRSVKKSIPSSPDDVFALHLGCILLSPSDCLS